MHLNGFLWQIWIQGLYNKRWKGEHSVFRCFRVSAFVTELYWCRLWIVCLQCYYIRVNLNIPAGPRGVMSMWLGGLCYSHSFIILCKCSNTKSRQNSEILEPTKSISYGLYPFAYSSSFFSVLLWSIAWYVMTCSVFSFKQLQPYMNVHVMTK